MNRIKCAVFIVLAAWKGHTGSVSQGLIAIILATIALAGLILHMGSRLDARIDEQGKDIKTLLTDVAALKATVETFLRVRVDPPVAPPPDEQRRTGTGG